MAGETVPGVRDGPDCGREDWDSGVNGSVEMTAPAAGEAGSECAIKRVKCIKCAVSIKQHHCIRIDCGKTGVILQQSQ